MAGKHYANLAREETYGTAPATGWAGAAVEDLGGHTPIVATLQPNFMKYGQQGPSTEGRRGLERGATGTIRAYLASAGLQTLLDGTFGPPEVTELAPGQAWESVYETSDEASLVSIATQVAREMKGGGLDRDTFVGGQVSEMRISQGLTPTSGGVTDEGLAKIEFDLNYQRRDPSHPERLPTYADPELYYAGGDFELLIGPDLDNLDDECLNEWALTVPTGLDLEDRCISTQVRDQASRGALPAPTMQMAWTYKGRQYYDAWLTGSILALRAKWEPTGDLFIAPGIKPSVTIDIAAFGINGEAPQESATETTKQNLPSDVLWNETDPMITITVVSSEEPVVDEAS